VLHNGTSTFPDEPDEEEESECYPDESRIGCKHVGSKFSDCRDDDRRRGGKYIGHVPNGDLSGSLPGPVLFYTNDTEKQANNHAGEGTPDNGMVYNGNNDGRLLDIHAFFIP